MNNPNSVSKPPHMQNSLILWGFLVLSAIMFSMIFNSKKAIQKEVSYNEFITAVKEKRVESVTFKGSEILGKFKDTSVGKGEEFKSYGDTSSDYYLKILGDNEIIPKYDPIDSGGFWSQVFIQLVPVIIILLVFFFILRGMKNSGGKVMSFGKLNLTSLNNANTKVKFDDVAGMDEAKEELTEIVDFLKNPKKYTELGGKIPKGALLIGPPGTGKTMIAKATANEAGVPFFAISGSDFIEMFVGVGASRVRDMFEQARRSAPAIIFIDEIDAMAKQRSGNQFGSNSEMDQTLNQLLVEMDGIDEKNKQIIVLAATNRVDILDQALLRPGRFDRRVTIPLPDIKGRKQILESHAKGKKMNESVDFEMLAKGTAGMSGADIANLLNESAIFAAKNNRKDIDMNSIEQAKDKILMGTERRSLVINPAEKEKTAWHEAGHALITKLLKMNTVYKVSIIPRGRALGVTQVVPEDNEVSFSKKKAKDFICVLMAGRAAEELKYQEFTTGASDDIRRATDLARKMVTEWGFSKDFGPINLSVPASGLETSLVSSETMQKVDAEIREILNSCYNETKDLLHKNFDKLEAITKLLIEKETISGDEILKIIN